MLIKKYIFWFIVSFFSGSVMYGFILPKLFLKKDVRENTIDKNPGSANAMRRFGKKIGIPVFVLEILKGALPVFIASKFVSVKSILFSFVMVACVLGHAFSPFMRFKGGKAIAVSFGALLGLVPHSFCVFLLLFLLIFFSLVIVIKPYAIRILTVYSSFIILLVIIKEPLEYVLGAFLIGLVVCIKHIREIGKKPLQIKFFKKDF